MITYTLAHLDQGRGLEVMVRVEEGGAVGESAEYVSPGERYEGWPYDAWAALPDGPVRLGASGPEAAPGDVRA